MSNPLLRQLVVSAARASVIMVMGPVMLVLAGTGDLTWARTLQSLKFTGPLAAVLFVGFALLAWGSTPEADTHAATARRTPGPPAA